MRKRKTEDLRGKKLCDEETDKQERYLIVSGMKCGRK